MYVVGFFGFFQLYVYRFGVKIGEILKYDIVEFLVGFCSEVYFVFSEILVFLDVSRKVLVILSLKDGKISFYDEYIYDFVFEFFGIAIVLLLKLEGIFLIKYSFYIIFLRIKDNGKFEVVDKIDDFVVVSDVILFIEEQKVFGIVYYGDSKFYFIVKFSDDYDNNFLKESIKMDYYRGFVQKVFINNYIRIDRFYGFRVLVVMEDYFLLLL